MTFMSAPAMSTVIIAVVVAPTAVAVAIVAMLAVLAVGAGITPAQAPASTVRRLVATVWEASASCGWSAVTGHCPRKTRTVAVVSVVVH